VENIARLQPRNRLGRPEEVFYVVDGGVILHDLGLGGCRGSLRQRGKWQEQAESDELNTQEWPPEFTDGSATHSRNGVNRGSRARKNTGPSAILFPVIMKASRATPLRIVSLAPSATSILCAMGAK